MAIKQRERKKAQNHHLASSETVSRGQPHVQTRLQKSLRSVSFWMPTVPVRTIPSPSCWPWANSGERT
ncbi:hypothetical protein WME75_15915 [Sorangium sp. So ce1014]|uniref:hypothetical protein n=1 Tax=Sorangium sp. So ce1014 TaxID=3133326 RepID=UPI003F5DCBA8